MPYSPPGSVTVAFLPSTTDTTPPKPTSASSSSSGTPTGNSFTFHSPPVSRSALPLSSSSASEIAPATSSATSPHYYYVHSSKPTPVSDRSAHAQQPITFASNVGRSTGMNQIMFPTTESPSTSFYDSFASPIASTTMIRKKSGELVKPSLKRTTSYPFASSSVSAPSSPAHALASLDSTSSLSSLASMSSLGTIIAPPASFASCSVSTNSSPPTQPQTPSKMVHFDAQLEHVKLFLAEQKPAAVSRDGSPEPNTTDTEGEGESGGEYFGYAGARYAYGKPRGLGLDMGGGLESLAGRIKASFTNFAPSSFAPLEGDESQSLVLRPLDPFTNVRLSSLELRGPYSSSPSASSSLPADTTSSNAHSQSPCLLSLDGTVMVRNLAFDKWIAIRFTLDDWQTVSEVGAKWIKSVQVDQKSASSSELRVGSSSSQTMEETKNGDLFGFSIKLSDHLPRIASKALMLCIRFRIPGSEWWDNNNGLNYIITFSLTDKEVPKQPPQVPARISTRPGLTVETQGSSSPGPEDLKMRLDKLSETRGKEGYSRSLRSRTGHLGGMKGDSGSNSKFEYGVGFGFGFSGAADNWGSEDEPDTDATRGRKKLSTTAQPTSKSTVPFPSKEKEMSTSAWLRSQQGVKWQEHPQDPSSSTSRSNGAEITRPREYRRSFTFPDRNGVNVFESFGPYVSRDPSGGSSRVSGLPSSSFHSTSFPADAFVSAAKGRGSPRDHDPHTDLTGSRRAVVSLDTPPLSMSSSGAAGSTSTSGSLFEAPDMDNIMMRDKSRRRHHQRTPNFDEWAADQSGQGDVSEMAKSGVKRTPPGTPVDVKTPIELPFPALKDANLMDDVEKDVPGTETYIISDHEQSVSAASSTETITLGTRLGLRDQEAEQNQEVEPCTPSLESTPPDSADSATSTSPSDDPSTEELMMRSASTYPSVRALFEKGSGNGEMEPTTSSPVDEEQRRRYAAFVDQFCFFTGGVGDSKLHSVPQRPPLVLSSVQSLPRSFAGGYPLALTPPSPRRSNSDSSVGSIFTSSSTFPSWAPPPHTKFNPSLPIGSHFSHSGDIMTSGLPMALSSVL